MNTILDHFLRSNGLSPEGERGASAPETFVALPALVGIAERRSAYRRFDSPVEWRPYDPLPSLHRASAITLQRDLEDLAKRADVLAAMRTVRVQGLSGNTSMI